MTDQKFYLELDSKVSLLISCNERTEYDISTAFEIDGLAVTYDTSTGLQIKGEIKGI